MPDQIITVESIVRKALVEMGADGLCHPDSECGCDVNDLAPCGDLGSECQPAYRKRCEKCGEDAFFPQRRIGPWVCGDCEGGDNA